MGGTGKTCTDLKGGANLYITGAETLGGLLYAGLPDMINTILDGIQQTLLGTAKDPGVNALVAGGQQLQDGLTGTIIRAPTRLPTETPHWRADL